VTSPPRCRSCPRIWGTWIRLRRTGICPQHRSCSPSPQNAWSSRRRGHDRARADARGVFHRPVNEKGASAHTIAAYRDTFRLLLSFAQQRTGTPPSKLQIEDLDAPLIAAFLDHLEHDRGNSPRTRNARLAAIHSMFRYAALNIPSTPR